jgi:hypothetical protein
MTTESGTKGAVGVGQSLSSLLLGRGVGSGFLRGNWGCLRGIPFFRYVFTNHGQGLSISLTLFHPLGMFFKEKEQLHMGDFYPFALPLAKQV